MKVMAVVAVVCLAVGAFAQNAPITTKTFSLNASPVALPGYGGNSFVGTDAGVAFSPTQNFTLESVNIMSSDAKLQFYGGGVEYKIPALSKYFNNKMPKVSGFRLLFGLRGAVGAVESTSPTKIGYLLQGTIDYSLDSAATWQFGVKAGAAKFPGYSNSFFSVIELGPSVHF